MPEDKLNLHAELVDSGVKKLDSARWEAARKMVPRQVVLSFGGSVEKSLDTRKELSGQEAKIESVGNVW